MMVEYPHALTECEECGAHYCMGCVGEECPSCKLQKVAFYAIELEEKLKGFKIDAERMCRKLKAIQTWYDSEKGYKIPGFEKLMKILEAS